MMKLISCHVENFGRLHDFDYIFSDGVNVICRENGWGKSTFAAFLLAMFYGLPAKGRKRQTGSGGSRLPAQNGRAAYKPWQGGVFGGSLIFETGGKTYEVTRIFGEREAQDEFDLRDPETNLPSFDYTKNIGKELFLLDRASFLRTVYTQQQDCMTETTDDVNALVANLAENAGDMESYEAAQKKLKEAANRLTPDRNTGELYRLSARIGQLEQRTAVSGDLEECIAQCVREQAELRQKEDALESEREHLAQTIAALEEKEREVWRRERADRDLQSKQQIRQRLYRTNERRREDARKAAAYFPHRVPARVEADVLIRNCREMERLEARMQSEMLTEEEQERLNLLEERFGTAEGFLEENPAVSEDAVFSARGKAAASAAKGRAVFAKEEELPPEKNPLLLPLGILLFAAGAVFLILTVGMGAVKGIPAPAAAAVSIVLVAAGAGAAAAGFLGRTDAAIADKRHRTAAEYPQEDALRSAAEYSQEDAFRSAEYRYLEKKEEKLEETYAAWAEARKPVLRFLKELGIKPEKDLHAQLISIRDAADNCEDAQALLRESEEELRLFEEELRRGDDVTERPRQEAALMTGHTIVPDGPGGIEEIEGIEGIDGIAALRRRQEEAHEELLRCRAQAKDTERRVEDLLSEREERSAMLEELKELREQQDADRAQYRHLVLASALLQKARESLTSRYTDPIRTGFCRYWEMITGYSAAGIYIDANSNVTIEERGKQREAGLLSTGWRDLAGICLRTALADAMYPPGRRERPPLIFDDPFTNLDDEKMKGAMRFLRETGRHYQILYFTCSRSRCRE